MSRFAAVCFDMDGVLIHTMPLHARAWREILAKRQVRVAAQEIYRREGEPGMATALDLLRHAPARDAKRALAEKERRFAQLLRAHRPVVDPRLARLLKRLGANGIRLALVTGTSSRELRRMIPARVLHNFHAVVTGDRVRHGKPHPEPFRRAFRALGHPPAGTLVVENAPYGIRSARSARAGRILVLASSLPPRYLRGADEVVASVATLTRRILALTGTRAR